jgi:hypothetical protein
MIEQVDPRSISQDKPCKRFSGKLLPKGVDLSRTPWSFWDNFTLRVDNHNVVWLSIPQNNVNTRAVEIAIAVLTSDATYTWQPTVIVSPLGQKNYNMPMHYVWEMIRLAFPQSKAKTNEQLYGDLGRHIEAFIKSPYVSFTSGKIDFLKDKTEDQARSYKKARKNRNSSKALKSFKEERKTREKAYRK